MLVNILDRQIINPMCVNVQDRLEGRVKGLVLVLTLYNHQLSRRYDAT